MSKGLMRGTRGVAATLAVAITEEAALGRTFSLELAEALTAALERLVAYAEREDAEDALIEKLVDEQLAFMGVTREQIDAMRPKRSK